MKNIIFLKLLSSVLFILIMLYFSPFLGIGLLILRLFICNNNKRRSIPIILISVGVLILVPKGLEILFNSINFDINTMTYLSNLINSPIYNENFMKYSKLLITIGMLYFILSAIVNYLLNQLKNHFRAYIINQEKKDYEISQKNNLIMKEKQEKSKNTKVIYCPFCGADNILTSNYGTCQYCRKQITAKDK